MYAIGIVGATGTVGMKITECLARRKFPVDYKRSRLFASEHSAGKMFPMGGQFLPLEHATDPEDFAGLDIVFLSAGGDATKTSVSKELCPMVVETGALAIDNSAAWRRDPNVPLIVAEVNPIDIVRHHGIIANPNCTTMIAMPVIDAIRRIGGLCSINVKTYQSVSGQGLVGVNEALTQTEAMTKSVLDIIDGIADPSDWPEPEIFPDTVGFNVTPLAGQMGDDGTTSEETKFVFESRKILHLPNLPISATCVRVPVLNGHSLALSVSTELPLRVSDIIATLHETSGVTVENIPTPLKASGKDNVLVGRIREDPTIENGIELFISGDNLLKGAALNAVQIAELYDGL